MTATTWPFIEVDDSRRPSIPSKGLKVLQLVREHLTYDWDTEQLHRQHPHLTHAEIHASLGYFYENRAKCTTMLEQEDRRLEELKVQLVNPDLQARLKSLRDKK